MVEDTGTGTRDGNLVVASPVATLPATGRCRRPPHTGRGKRLSLAAVTARPAEDLPFDGGISCPLPSLERQCIGVERTNGLVPSATIRREVPGYYFVGYGQLSTSTLALALSVLDGTTPLPLRLVANNFFSLDATFREGF